MQYCNMCLCLSGDRGRPLGSPAAASCLQNLDGSAVLCAAAAVSAAFHQTYSQSSAKKM